MQSCISIVSHDTNNSTWNFFVSENPCFCFKILNYKNPLQRAAKHYQQEEHQNGIKVLLSESPATKNNPGQVSFKFRLYQQQSLMPFRPMSRVIWKKILNMIKEKQRQMVQKLQSLSPLLEKKCRGRYYTLCFYH